MAEVFCNQCGHRNPVGSNFCSSCGAALEPHRDDRTITFQGIDPAGEPPEEEVSFSLDDLPPDTGMLIVKRGDNAGSKFALQREVTTAGRHPTATSSSTTSPSRGATSRSPAPLAATSCATSGP